MTMLVEDRILAVDCGINFRDFGGYATADGGRVKTGMLYRSGLMSFVEGAGRDRLAALGIAAICDLRTSGERQYRPTRWHEGLAEPVHFWSRDYAHTNADLSTAIRTANDPSATRAMMVNLYRDLAYDHAESFRALFALLLEGKVPLLVNCSAGKDRTGTAVTLVLSALGVPRDTILDDYLLTTRTDLSGLLKLTERAAHRSTSEAALAPLLAAEPDYLDALFTAIDTRSGSMHAYLSDQLGVGAAERDRLRMLLVDG